MTRAGILKFALKKLFRYALTFFLIATLIFILPRMMPGDPIVNKLGEKALHADPQTLAMLRAYYGLDKPLHVQYVNYLMSILRLDLGYSITKNLRVSELIGYRLFWTTALSVPAIALGGLIGLLLGSIAGYYHGKKIDALLTGANLLLFTCPSFFLAMLAVSAFGFHLGWFPLGNISSGTTDGFAYLADVAWHLFLPVAVLSAIGAVCDFLTIRSSVKEVMGEYFVFVARAKGLPERAIALRHVARNILPQFISIMALNFGFMVSGALIIEIVFSLNGMGVLIYDAVLARDYPVLQGALLVLTAFVLSANFLADLLYGIADPRIGEAKNWGPMK
jgi:peptide/nickel transport system permease protein